MANTEQLNSGESMSFSAKRQPVFQVEVTAKLSKIRVVLGVYTDEEVAKQMLERLHRPNWPFYAFTLGVRRVAC